MTFEKAAWAIDGPLTKAALARVQAFAATAGSEGVIDVTDLKVTQLATPGAGLLISPGAGIVLNRYQGSKPNQSYTVVNPSAHTVSGSAMPPQMSSAQDYIVGVVVGDPEFSQTGHPFMPTTIPSGQESSFTYVRPMILSASAFGGAVGSQSWPFLPLALLSIPANTTTITNSMITDLRQMAQPRTKLAQGIASLAAGATQDLSSVGTWQRFPNVPVLSIQVPKWATVAKIMGTMEGVRLNKSGSGSLQVYIEGGYGAGAWTNVDEFTPSNERDRRSYSLAGEINVSAIRGGYVVFSVRGQASNSASANFLRADQHTQVMLSVFFEEVPT